MNVEFRASFSRDLKNVGTKELLKRIRETIEEIELAHSLQDVSGVKKLKGASKFYRIKVGEYRIGLALKGTQLCSCDAWIEKTSTDIFRNPSGRKDSLSRSDYVAQ